jgi:hypothetical protein
MEWPTAEAASAKESRKLIQILSDITAACSLPTEISQ